MEEKIKKKLRIGKRWSLGIAAAFMFFLTDAYAQEHTQESMSENQEETVTDSTDLHNLDYRKEHDEDFGKKDKLKDDRDKAYQDEENQNEASNQKESRMNEDKESGSEFKDGKSENDSTRKKNKHKKSGIHKERMHESRHKK
jgi:hypothetical protein